MIEQGFGGNLEGFLVPVDKFEDQNGDNYEEHNDTNTGHNENHNDHCHLKNSIII